MPANKLEMTNGLFVASFDGTKYHTEGTSKNGKFWTKDWIGIVQNVFTPNGDRTETFFSVTIWNLDQAKATMLHSGAHVTKLVAELNGIRMGKDGKSASILLTVDETKDGVIFIAPPKAEVPPTPPTAEAQPELPMQHEQLTGIPEPPL
jgi:hypothetical protein